MDGETGQYYYRARYYDAAIGRFISEDTIAFAAGDANLYRYVGNSPVNRIDPSGNDWLDTAYNVGNGLDQFAAGFGHAVSFGATTRMREAMYGDVATQNHRGGLFNAGQVAGTATSLALGYGAEAQAFQGANWAVRASQGYMAVGNVTATYQSTRNLLKGCFSPTDLLGFAPAAGAGLKVIQRLRLPSPTQLPINGWKNLPGGMRIQKIGKEWIKEVNPDAPSLIRWWARGSLDAQYKGLDLLGDMAPNFSYRNGRLVVGDVGGYIKGNFGNTWLKGSARLGTPFNDIRTRNIGGMNNKIFDPAKHPIQQTLEAVVLGGIPGITVGVQNNEGND